MKPKYKIGDIVYTRLKLTEYDLDENGKFEMGEVYLPFLQDKILGVTVGDGLITYKLIGHQEMITFYNEQQVFATYEDAFNNAVEEAYKRFVQQDEMERRRSLFIKSHNYESNKTGYKYG